MLQQGRADGSTSMSYKSLLCCYRLVAQYSCSVVVLYLEVFWKEQFAGPEETENVAEYLAIPIYEVVLLQAVQHDGLGAIEQTTDSEN